jgi:Dynamitin
LRALQSELAALETELADPSNPLLQKEREENHVDPGELIRGLVDVRGRLDNIRRGKEGRGRLVEVVTGTMVDEIRSENALGSERRESGEGRRPGKERKDALSDVASIAEMDRRVGELEKLVGSSGVALDEVFLRRDFSTYGANYFPGLTTTTPITSAHNATQHAIDASYTTSTYRLHISAAKTSPLRPRSRFGFSAPSTASLSAVFGCSRSGEFSIGDAVATSYETWALTPTYTSHSYAFTNTLISAYIGCRVSEHARESRSRTSKDQGIVG